MAKELGVGCTEIFSIDRPGVKVKGLHDPAHCHGDGDYKLAVWASPEVVKPGGLSNTYLPISRVELLEIRDKIGSRFYGATA